MNTQLFIDGQFVPAKNGGTIDVLNPSNGELITKIAAAEAEDIDIAVAVAKRAFPSWAATPAAERGRLLLKLADLIEEHTEELAQLESLDTGHPIRDSRRLDVPRTAACFRYFGGIADKIEGSVIPVEQGFLNYVVREPIGVVGQIVPWNFPLMFTSWKLGPALAAGNTVVMKPSELTPLSTLKIAELIKKAGFPDGVVNIVAGYGHTAGQRLAEHEDVGKIAFTGSTLTGQNIVRSSVGNLKRVQLELGGKGANIVFEDANIDAAVNGAAWAIFHNQGQACIAGSRLVLHEAIADEFLEKFIKLAESIRLGDPLDPETEMGPLTSEAHRNKVLSYVEVAKEQGGRVLTGGKAPEDINLKNGYYVLPTVVEAKPMDRVAQEEVFGPFVTVLRFKTDQEALEIANCTEYGLGSGLWTQNLQRAHQFAKNIKAGMCWINSYKRVNPGSPFGGVGKSGYGREMGFEAIHDYTEAKSIWVNVDANIPPHFQRG
ncbi:aldehyde dehydrogenase family protein [Acinetobacter pittii]|uniref:aldehyde dehydrogenase family protein n=1 Tax=Acinetobacter calcoaceticus/baumannii complex TaxID=909768 RepID=UPI000707377A|nr:MULTISPECIES: aldehyde dehydrogenase family protein [Acinetobacter calcoaceticus/baumannii complex]KQE91859.1 betaine-aldehyde dehydrogenase [Acinetobacter lactucae]QXA08851.1 aldehyde dehydrogenase family protein [Acinetobacter pittii]